MDKPSKLAAGLYLVASPIGNSRDISQRALDYLAGADLLLCESLARGRKLLALHGIARKEVESLRDDSAPKRIGQILDKIESGASVALISDAGTPLISDPGAQLVSNALKRGLLVDSIPGASALATTLSLCGFGPKEVYFVGFLPRTKSLRRLHFARAQEAEARLVFFESPKRVASSLKAALDFFGDTQVLVARELSKLHQEVTSSSLAKVCEAGAIRPQGEFTIVISPQPIEAANKIKKLPDQPQAILNSLLELKPRKRAELLAQTLTFSKAEIYKALRKLSNRQ